VNAGRLLRETGYDITTLRTEIDPVDPDRVNLWPAGGLLRRLWRPGIRAVTLWKWVLVDPETIDGDREQLARLTIHEMVHLRQFALLGYLRFTFRYLKEYLSSRLSGLDHRAAYLDISAEREAREVTDRIRPI